MMRDIGKNIRDLRQMQNMTQDDLAERLFVTRQTVSNYETGRTRPDVEMVVKIAEVLGTDANTILYGIPTPPDKKRQLKIFSISAAVTLAIYVLYLYLGDWAMEIRATYYQVLPNLLLAIWGKPLVSGLFGWTLALALGCFTKLTPIRNRVSKWLRIGSFALIGFYIAVMLCYLFFGITLRIPLPNWVNGLVFFLLGALPGQIIPFNHGISAFIFGCLLWLFRSPHNEKKETA